MRGRGEKREGNRKEVKRARKEGRGEKRRKEIESVGGEREGEGREGRRGN